MNLVDLSEALLRVASDRLAQDDPRLFAAFQIELATELHFYGALAELGERLEMQALARLTGDRADGADDPTPHLVAMVDAWARRARSARVQPLLGGHQERAPVAPIRETRLQRRDRRVARVVAAFRAAGFTFPAEKTADLPDGSVAALVKALDMHANQVRRDLDRGRGGDREQASKARRAKR